MRALTNPLPCPSHGRGIFIITHLPGVTLRSPPAVNCRPYFLRSTSDGAFAGRRADEVRPASAAKQRQMELLNLVKRGVLEENDPYTWGLYTEDAGFFSEKE